MPRDCWRSGRRARTATPGWRPTVGSKLSGHQRQQTGRRPDSGRLMETGRDHVTQQSLTTDLGKLGVRAGQQVLLHASLRSLGWVDGGAAAVVGALRDVLGPVGTLVVPAMTPGNSDTSRLYQERTQGMTWWQRRRYRCGMPPFDPASTPGAGTGHIAEHVRTGDGAVRSAHPQSSFAAIGAQSKHFMRGHAPDCHFGERSPLARLYEAGGQILLLGVGYESCTAFHLAEYRYTADPPRRRYACVVMRNGRRKWWHYQDVVLDDSDFAAIGKALAATDSVRTGTVGAAEAALIPLRAAVDFAVDWLAVYRDS
jgi:aminoglycoside 3-N-acetyltransferase